MASDAAKDPKAPKADGSTRWDRVVRSSAGQAMRWLAVLILLLGHWLVTMLGPITGHAHWLTTASLVFGQKGNPGSFAGWVPVIIISLLLLLPDAESVAFGTVKLQMRQTREEVTGLRDQVTTLHATVHATQLQVAKASALSIGQLLVTDPQMLKDLLAAFGTPKKIAESDDADDVPFVRGAP